MSLPKEAVQANGFDVMERYFPNRKRYRRRQV